MPPEIWYYCIFTNTIMDSLFICFAVEALQFHLRFMLSAENPDKDTMRARTIACGSLSKTYSITGWRLGYVIARPEVIAVARKVHDFLTVGAASPLQEAAVTALRFDDSYYDWLQTHYTKKRDLFLKGLSDIGLPHTEPQGAYYVMDA